MNTCCNNIYPEMDKERWESCPSTMLANADNYYNKNQVDEKLEEIVISGGGITSGEVQSMIDASVEPIEGSVEALSGTVGQLSTDMENKADRSEIPSLSGYATEQWVENQNYLTEHQPLKTINGQVISGTGNITISGSADLSNYYTKSQIDTKLDRKENNLEMYEESRTGHPYDWSAKITANYNWLEVNGRGIAIAADENSSISLEAPTATLNQSPIVNEDRAYEIAEEYIANTVQCSLDGQTTGSGQWESSGSFRFKLNDDTPEYANTLPALQYSVTRYSGNTPDEFVISPSDGTGQYKKGNATLRGFEVEGYQKTLSAGTGIAINGNVISATGGGSGITVDQSLDSGSTNPVTNSAITQAINAKADASNVYNKTEVYTKTEVNNIVNNKFVCITQAQYDALPTKQPDTLYLIYEV